MKKTMIVIFGLAMALFLIVCPTFAENWHVPGDFDTVQQAIDSPSVVAGDKIFIGVGQWAGATVNKPVEIQGENGTIIISGPDVTGVFGGLKLVNGSAGTKISHLQFEPVQIGIPGEIQVGIAGVGVADVTVTQCIFKKLGQGLLLFGAHGWKITHNEVYDPQYVYAATGAPIRGGCGMSLVNRDNSETSISNLIEHNKILGTVGWNVPEGKGTPSSGNVGIGILLMRQTPLLPPNDTPGEVSQNWINYNFVELVPGEMLSAVGSKTRGFSLTDRQPSTETKPRPTINMNTIAFNDFRGCDYSVGTNVKLEQHDVLGLNIFSRNLGGLLINSGYSPSSIFDYDGIGDNRGYGVTPASSLKP
jgi:hypothetical protein